MNIEPLLQIMIDQSGSDLFLSVGRAPSIKVNGEIFSVGKQDLTPALTRALALKTMEAWQRDQFLSEKELNYALISESGERFRANAYFHMGSVGMVVRRIRSDIPTPESLFLPPVLSDLVMAKRGIMIYTGATGVGKSTSLAALIGHRNREASGHIVTVEDPIEFVHQHDRCIVTQREVGIDTDSWQSALKNVLRQAPDVILIGEIRDQEAMESALAMAETGHLVLATLHTNNANQALDRIIHFFPVERREQVLLDLSLNLQAIVAQQLVPTAAGQRRAVFEVLINTPFVADLIAKGEVRQLKDAMAKSGEAGMQTFDQALFELYSAGEISYDNAMAFAESKNDLRLAIKLKDDPTVSDASTEAFVIDLADYRFAV